MKRVICAAVLVLCIIAISVLSLCDMEISLSRIGEEAEELRQSAAEKSPEDLREECEALMQNWTAMEDRFLLYVRHDHLDNIMEKLTMLPAYAQDGEQAELLSNLDAAIRMMSHLKDSVTPNYHTLL